MKAVFDEIRDGWRLEAKAEDSERYFFQTNELGRILSGRKAYVIGRKGTGKTAISQNILASQSHNVFCDKLSFKNFPFNELYGLEDKGYRPPNQYITLWKYIIYNKICQMMSINEAIDSNLVSRLRKIYEFDNLKKLDKEINRWTTKEFNINILGVGGGIKGDVENEPCSWTDKCDMLEGIILEYIDESDYYIAFDELDEDYKNVFEEKNDNYISLLTGLFKAVQSIKSTFTEKRYHIFPVIFLRNDIYDLIMDSDKAKWDDLKLDLLWNEENIKKLIAFRIERTFDRSSDTTSFIRSWEKIFRNENIGVGTQDRKKIDMFTYMTRSTQLRPRDYIKYIVACAEENTDNKIITSKIVKMADEQFSYYLRSELIDEIQGVLPNIEVIFEILSSIRKQTFLMKDFRECYSQLIKLRKCEDYGVEFTLNILFFFSVVGNLPRQNNRSVFRYIDRGARFNFNEPILVHRGLYQSLQIF